MSEPHEDVLKPGVVLVDRRGVEWRRATGYQEQEKARPGWMLLVSANGDTMPFPEVVERYGTFGAGSFDPLGLRLPRLVLNVKPESIETRPQDWAEEARRILRERGAWRGRA